MLAADIVDVFGSQTDDQGGDVQMGGGHLTAAMLAHLQPHRIEGGPSPKAHGLTLDGQRPSRLHHDVRGPSEQGRSGHDRASRVSSAKEKDGGGLMRCQATIMALRSRR